MESVKGFFLRSTLTRENRINTASFPQYELPTNNFPPTSTKVLFYRKKKMSTSTGRSTQRINISILTVDRSYSEARVG
jgi:hypothetical protein